MATSWKAASYITGGLNTNLKQNISKLLLMVICILIMAVDYNVAILFTMSEKWFDLEYSCKSSLTLVSL